MRYVHRQPPQLAEPLMFCEVPGRDTRGLTFGWRLWVILQVSSLEDGSGLWKILGGDRIPNEGAACRKSGERKVAWRGGAHGHQESTLDRTGWFVGCGVRKRKDFTEVLNQGPGEQRQGQADLELRPQVMSERNLGIA